MSFVLSSPGASLTQQVAASAIGPITVDSFKLYSAYGYPTNPGSTPQGSIVFAGTLTSVTRKSDTDIQIQLDVPPPVTDLSVGAIAIYTDSGELFALHVYNNPVQLYAKTTDASSALRVRGRIPVPAGETTVIKMGSPFITPTTYAPAAVLPAPAVSTRVQVSSPDAPTISLEGVSATQWEVLGHTKIHAVPVIPSAVGVVSGNTSITIPGSVGLDQVNPFNTGRYVVQGPAGQIARAMSLTVASTNVVVRLDGTYAWATTSAAVTVWENRNFTFVTHQSPSFTLAHSSYLTVASSAALYSPLSHTTAADPHTDFILKTSASSGGISLTPLGHLVSADPHGQYQLKSAALASFLPATINSLIQDASSTPRFIWSRLPSQLPSFTEVRGTPNLSNSRSSSIELWGTGLSPLLYAKSNGSLVAPSSNLAVSNQSASVAVTAWTQSRIRDPQSRRLREVTGTGAAPLALDVYDGYHIYSGQNKTSMDIPTVMNPAGVYEVLFTALCRVAPVSIGLLVNSTDIGPVYSCQRADILSEQPWTQSTFISQGGSNNLTVQTGTMWTLNYDENHNEGEQGYAYKNFETAGAPSVTASVTFRCRNSLEHTQAIMQTACSVAGAGVQIRYESGFLQILKANSWSPFTQTVPSVPAIQSVAFDVTQWTTMTATVTDNNDGTLTVIAQLKTYPAGASIGTPMSTVVNGTIGDYTGFVNGHADDAPWIFTTDYDNLSVTTPTTFNRLTAPFKNVSVGKNVSGRIVLTPANRSAQMFVNCGDDVSVVSARTISGATPWTSVGRLSSLRSLTDSIESGYSWWAAVRRIG